MRYGILRISKEYMKRLLGLSEETVCFTRVTDLPDDIDIESISYDSITRSFIVLLKGSGVPLKKVSEGTFVPNIFIEFMERLPEVKAK